MSAFRTRFASVSVSIWLATALSVAPSGRSQPPRPPAPGQPPIKTGVNLVRVDVYPTRDGVPVLDLRQEDFEVLEDGAPQHIESFEHVVVRPAGPQSARVEPSSQRESLQAVANPRNRVFVIFLDLPNVTIAAAHAINEPIIRLIDRILGPDDLVGVMTPAMSASQLVLGRKTEVIEDSLRRNWAWGRRDSFLLDEREIQYDACYPKTTAEGGQTYSKLAWEMILRKRERATFEAMQDLVRYLQAIREERKAIITVTEGWVRYRENRDMMRLREDPITGRQEPVPGRDPIVVGPTGKLTTRDERRLMGRLSPTECDAERMRLAMMDNDQFFRDLVGEANRANVSFYPVDPRGLPAFDTSIEQGVPLHLDRVYLRSRQDALHELAINTDAIAVMDNNDLDRGLKRIADDLTSYYLLGYYSTNPKLDGGFRQIRVRVKQRGVNVRARRGYRAATIEEVTNARMATESAAPDPSRSAFTAAMGTLGRIRPDARLRINATAAATGVVWVAGELLASGNRSDDPSLGATADIEATAGQGSATSRVTLSPGERTFLTTLKLAGSTDGAIDVRARVTPEGGTPLTDSVRIETGAQSVQPLVFRRGATTGNRVMPAADFRFSRTERLRLEIPSAADAKPQSGRVLDRNGKPLEVPVQVGERTDTASGQRWITGDVVLAPLAPGDYAIEIAIAAAGGEQRVVMAVRVTR